ncbi:MAG: hypothetical protein FWD69_05125 [Polyangiaceae bacterium]|nr:hypothetical protein [Polyangiaceae bacterium]
MKALALSIALLLFARAACADDAKADKSSASADPAAKPLRSPRFVSPPDTSYGYAGSLEYPSYAWIAAQLVPSPELAFGRIRRIDVDGHAKNDLEVTFGLRWQVTPVLYSWGTYRTISPWRFVVVDPIARHSGSIEADLALEYLGGDVSRMLVRPGVHATFPLLQRGEYWSASLGTSVYTYDAIPRVAYTVGTYFLFGLFGVELTLAPAHEPLKTMATFRIRYF